MRLRALLAEAALQGARLVLLDPLSADIAAGRIATEVWSGGGWTRQQAALPDVVIIRGRPLIQAQVEVDRWVRQSRPIIFDRGISKQELSTLLTGTACEGYLIPDAVVDPERPQETITAFLQAHGEAAIKRADGQRGIGVLFVSREEAGWALRQDRTTFRGTLDEVAAQVTARIAGRLRYRQYILQRFIRSLAADGRAADFRVHVQRRADGKFAPTRAYVRLAEVGMPVANTSRGGYQGPLDGFLQQRRCRPAREIEDEMLGAALALTELLDATRETPLSELGVDLLLDELDRLWVIELNAMPQSSQHEHERAIHTIGYALRVASRGLVPSSSAVARDPLDAI